MLYTLLISYVSSLEVRFLEKSSIFRSSTEYASYTAVVIVKNLSRVHLFWASFRFLDDFCVLAFVSKDSYFMSYLSLRSWFLFASNVTVCFKLCLLKRFHIYIYTFSTDLNGTSLEVTFQRSSCLIRRQRMTMRTLDRYQTHQSRPLYSRIITSNDRKVN